MEGLCQLYLPKLNGRKVLGREKENMYRKDSEGWLKHADFIVLDMICLQLAFILAYAFRGYGFNVYGDILYRNMAIFLGFADLVVIFTSGTMKSVLKRGHYKEFVTTLKNAVAVGALAIAYLFIIQEGQSFSRMILITTIVIYLVLTYAIREIWKNSLHKKMENGGDKKLLIITSKGIVIVLLAFMNNIGLSNAIINRTYFIGCLLIFLFIVLGTAILINKIIEQCPVKVSEMLTGGRSGATHNKRSFVKNIKNR